MARTAGLFIESTKTIEDLAREVAEVASIATSPTTDPGVWKVDMEGTTGQLATSRPGVVGTALARRYRFAVAVELSDGVPPGASPAVSGLRDLGRRLREDAHVSSLLILDVQNRQEGASAEAEAQRVADGEPAEPVEPGVIGA